MKTSITTLTLFLSLAQFTQGQGVAAAQQTPSMLSASRPVIQRVYSHDGTLRLTLQRTPTGLRVYRQVGTHTVPMH